MKVVLRADSSSIEIKWKQVKNKKAVGMSTSIYIKLTLTWSKAKALVLLHILITRFLKYLFSSSSSSPASLISHVASALKSQAECIRDI